MTGQELRYIIEKRGIAIAAIAMRIGVSPQNLNSTLKSPDVKSSIIEQCARAMDLTLEQMYRLLPSSPTSTPTDGVTVQDAITPEASISSVSEAPSSQPSTSSSSDVSGALLHLVSVNDQLLRRVDDLILRIDLIDHRLQQALRSADTSNSNQPQDG